MLPYLSEKKSHTFPWLNILLVLLNIGVFVWFFYRTDTHTVLEQLAFIPAGWWLRPHTLVSYSILHGGWLHLVSNMLFLWIFGGNVEDILGHGRYLVFYLMAAVTGALLHGLFYPVSDIPLVGASGAVSGVLAAFLVLLPRTRIRVLLLFLIRVRIPALVFILLWVATQVWMAWSSLNQPEEVQTVAYIAHVGGIGFGLLYCFAKRKELLRHWKIRTGQTQSKNQE